MVRPGGRGRGGGAGARRAGSRAPAGRRRAGSRASGSAPTRRVRWERKASSWRMSARLMPCSRAISPSRPRSSAERSRAARAPSGVISTHRRSSVTCVRGVAEQRRGALQQRGRAPPRAARGGPSPSGCRRACASTPSTSRARIDSPWPRTRRSSRCAERDLAVEMGEQLRLEHRVHRAPSRAFIAA